MIGHRDDLDTLLMAGGDDRSVVLGLVIELSFRRFGMAKLIGERVGLQGTAVEPRSVGQHSSALQLFGHGLAVDHRRDRCPEVPAHVMSIADAGEAGEVVGDGVGHAVARLVDGDTPGRATPAMAQP